MEFRLTGLIAATFTPLKHDGSLNLDQVPRIVDQLAAEGCNSLYVCGSTGEGVSLTGEERMRVAESYTRAANGRLRVIVQVGHNSVLEARGLAAHAQRVGADAVSATCPSYFKPESVELLVDCMAEIAGGAPELPFYYYHIPALTGVGLDITEFLRLGASKIPTLAGIKYTQPTVHEFQTCTQAEDGRFDIVWGTDEMLLSALVVGARGAIGSTYNVAAPLYRKILAAFEAGELGEAARLQALSVSMIRQIKVFPFHSAMKELLKMIGLDCGPCRLPHPPLSGAEADQLRKKLEKIGYFDWGRPAG